MEDRLRTQELFSRKDGVIIANPTFDAREVNGATAVALRFFARIWDLKTKRVRFLSKFVLGVQGLFAEYCEFVYLMKNLYYGTEDNLHERKI